MSARIYLDNSATSWPKPRGVYDAVDRWQRESGVAVGRSGTRQGMELGRIVDRCRRRAAELLGAPDSRRIVFGFNGTDSLNLAIHGLLRAGDRVVTTHTEHNSVLRPLESLRASHGVQTRFIDSRPDGVIELDSLRSELADQPRLVIVNHVSNVTGAIQPIDEVIQLSHAAGAKVLVDAAQSAGHLPIDVSALAVDLLACSGHKGMLGPLGTSILYVAEGNETELAPVRQGGTGTSSEAVTQPIGLPERYESGNQNAPGLVGLDAALGWLLETGVEAIRAHEQELVTQLIAGLTPLPGLRIDGPANIRERTGVVSLTVDGYDPRELAALLDSEFGIEVRAGLHCAPRMHAVLGTLERGGTVRLSPGPFTSAADIAATIEAFAQITSSSLA
ncbi:MAG: aminotransferase class V-fold PLP-dependent enzyme [Planctomycetaceae bacterium]